MICPKCNYETNEGYECVNCGYIFTIENKIGKRKKASVDRFVSSKQNMQYNLDNNDQRKFYKKNISDSLAVILFSIFISIAILFSFNSHIDKTIEAVRNEDDALAVKYYKKFIMNDKDELKMFDQKIENYMKEVYDLYNDGEMDYAKAVRIYDFIYYELKSDIAKKYISMISRLSTSKDSYAKGWEELRAEEYLNAVAYYSKVIEEDKNYEDAKNLISVAQEKNSEKYINIIDEVMNKVNPDLVADGYEIISTINLGKEAGTIDLNDITLNQKYQNLLEDYANEVYEQAQRLNNEGKSEEAYTITKQALELMVKDNYNEDVKAKLNQLNASIKSNIKKSIEEEFADKVEKREYINAYNFLINNSQYFGEDEIEEKVKNLITELFNQIS